MPDNRVQRAERVRLHTVAGPTPVTPVLRLKCCEFLGQYLGQPLACH